MNTLKDTKDRLKKNGYVVFNLKDFVEFESYYNELLDLKCTENNNLKEKMTGLRFNSISQHIREQLEFKSFTEAYKTGESLFEKLEKKEENVFQYWYFSCNGELTDKFKPIIQGLSKEFYDLEKEELDLYLSCTYYPKNCILKTHTDGYSNNRICAILIYLNENYNKDWGGNLIVGNDIVVPEYGNVVILNFDNSNIQHGVTMVTDGPGRYAHLSFVSTKKTNNQQNPLI